MNFLFRHLSLPGLLFLAILSPSAFCATGGEDQDAARPLHCLSAITGYLEGPADDPMHAPSHVLPLRNGRTAVLDGANHRVAFFDARGAFETYVGARGNGPEQLEYPLGMCSGPGDTLIVADTGNARLKILDPKGIMLRDVPIPPLEAASAPVGVAWDPEGKRLFVTDRNNHVVQRIRIPGFDFFKPLLPEKREEAPDPYPYAPVWFDDCLFWLEPLSGTICQCLPEKGLLCTWDFWGIGPGALYRPKGAAVDAHARLFVSDSYEGTLSLFSMEGDYLGQVLDEKGRARRLDSPTGMAFGPEGKLLVVEMARHRVVQLGMWFQPELNVPLPEPVSREEDPESRKPGACRVCHVETFRVSAADPSGEAGARKVPDEAVRPELCFSCHDGSITESRDSAFADHGHARKAGEQGSCMICHQAHGENLHGKTLNANFRHGDTETGQGETLACYKMETAIFLKLPGPKGELCMNCHASLAGQGHIGHPMEAMDGGFPESLVQAGAAPPAGIDGGWTCRTCHVAHGRRSTQLLVGSEGPCALCHENVDHNNHIHCRQGGLYCWECHSAHKGPRPHLLADPYPEDRRECIVCHGDMDRIRGTAHDLSKDSDTCLACHCLYDREGANEFMWKHGFGPGSDPVEKRCSFCHNDSNPISTKAVNAFVHNGQLLPGDVNHGTGKEPQPVADRITCVTCHEPHSAARSFLRPGVARMRCAPCHGKESLWLYLNYHSAPQRKPADSSK